MDKKVIIFGIDGGTWTVLKPAIEQGHMPFLKSLMDQGASGILKSSLPAITPAAWGSFQTGKNPGKTGVFDFSSWDVKEKKNHYASSLNLGQTIWSILSDHQKRIGVLNVPMTYPPQPINGSLISGLLTPSLESDFTYPKELKQQLLKENPDYHIFNIKNNAEYTSSDEHFQDFIQQMLSIIENRTQTALWILKKEPLDVFMVHFQAPDVLQHVYWQYLDSSHKLFQSDKQACIFKTVYSTLDQKIQTIYQTFTEINGQPLTLAISDHGFQAHAKRFNLGNWLVEEGYLKIHKNRKKTPSGLKKITKSLRLGKMLKLFMPHKTVQSLDKKYISKTDFINWDTSTAYSVGRSNEGFIYLLPDDETERTTLQNELKNKLLALRDPQTGQPVVQQVHFKPDIYHGDQTNNLPHIIIQPAEGYSFTGSYQFGKKLFHTVTPQEDMHMGKHHSDGIMVIAGNEIQHRTQQSAGIMDIAPTLLYYLGIPIPLSMDGVVLTDLFTTAYRDDNSVVKETKENDQTQKSANSAYSEKDNEDIEKRLKDLGYL